MIKKEIISQEQQEKKEKFEKEQELLFEKYYLIKNKLSKEKEGSKKYESLKDLLDVTAGNIIESNNGLILKIAHKRMVDGVELEDLIQEGRKGMYEALLRYDQDRDIKFVSYAYKYIDGSLHNFIRDNSRTIRVQWLASENYRLYAKCLDDFKIKYNKYPLDRELLDFMNSNEETKYMVSSNKSNRGTWDLERLKRMKMIADQTSLSSIHDTFGGENDTEFFEVIEDKSIQRPDEISEENDRAIRIRKKLDELFDYYKDNIDTKIIIDVLKLRFGLYDEELKIKIIETIKKIGKEEFGPIKPNGLTLLQVSYVYDITRESARIYESVGLRQLQILAGAKPYVEIKQGNSFRFLNRDLHIEKSNRIKVEFVNCNKDIISVDQKTRFIKGLKVGTATLLVHDKNTNRDITYVFTVLPNENKTKKGKTLRKEA